MGNRSTRLYNGAVDILAFGEIARFGLDSPCRKKMDLESNRGVAAVHGARRRMRLQLQRF